MLDYFRHNYRDIDGLLQSPTTYRPAPARVGLHQLGTPAQREKSEIEF